MASADDPLGGTAMNDDERLKKGVEMFKKAYGDVVKVPDVNNLTPYAANSLKNLFGEIYTRALDPRSRRLLILGAIAGMGADPSLFDIHVRSALANGEIKPEELEEFCLVLVAYCGYPKISPLYVACQKLLHEKAKS
jgi:alkylhydroperoxidase/carboxymuconolactone decarboxylase family protein YurZ